MKKLLTIFGAFALTATGASSVVACNKNTSTTDSNITQDSYTLEQIFPNKDLGTLEIELTQDEIDHADQHLSVIRTSIFNHLIGEMYKLNKKSNEKIFRKANIPYNFDMLFSDYYQKYLEEVNDQDYLGLNLKSKTFSLHYKAENLRQEFEKAGDKHSIEYFSKIADSDITLNFIINPVPY
ncbi:lipoprotein [Spiroplasma sp. DGKH1]|uniref:lipoprotein n=1 Tax=Spiroplasma sp. DGKH1 TaxID=3050074 RepID=UPI0034C66EDE